MIFAYAILAGFAFLALAYLLVRIARDPVLGVCIFVFLSAITMTPELPVIGDRLIAADGIMIFVILTCAFNGILFRAAPPGLRLIDQLAGVFIGIAILSSLLALFTRGDPMRVILFLLIYLYGYLCFRLILRLLTTEDALRRVFLWWAAATIMVVVVGFLAATGIYRPAWTYDPIINRINSTFKMSGQVSSYLGPAMFLLFYLATLRQASFWKRGSFVLLLLAAAYVMMGTGSRTGFVVMSVSIFLGFMVILTTPSRLVRKGELFMAIGAGLAVFFSFAASVWTDTSVEYGLTTTSPFERALRMWSEQTSGNEIRLATIGGTRAEEISVAMANLDAHLFLGVGSGMFSRTYQINEIHNTYISVLAENGLLAFIALMLWWGAVGTFLFTTASRLRGTRRLILRLVTLGFLSISIYQVTINGMRQRPFWFVPAIALATACVLRRSAVAENGAWRAEPVSSLHAAPGPVLRPS